MYISPIRPLIILLSLYIGSIFLAQPASGAVLQHGSYSIYRIDATTKKSSLLTKGTESKRPKVMTLCMTQVKKEKNSGIQCIWNNKLIFSKKAPRVFTPKNTTPKTSIPTVSNEPKSNFDGYIDGRIAVQNHDITKTKALDTCKLMMSANPTSEITCRWGGEVLDSKTIATLIESGKIEIVASSMDTSTGKYLMRNKEQSIGSFALKSGSGNSLQKLEKITLKNIGSAPLTSLVYNITDARLIDIETGKSIPATAKISNTNIEFSDITLSLSGDTIRHFRILMSIIDIPSTADASTIGLSISPEDIIMRDANTSTRTNIAGNPYIMKAYTLGIVPPTLMLTNIGENLFRMKVVNPDENHHVTVTTIGASTTFSLPMGRTFVGILCARDRDTSGACGSNGSTTLASPSSGNSISLINASMTTTISIGGTLEVDFYISSNDIYPTGAQTQMTVDSLTYKMDGRSFTVQFGGLPSSRSTYSK